MTEDARIIAQRKWRTRLIMAIIFGAGFFVMLGLLLFIEIPGGNREVLITLLGGLGGSVATIIAFYFGDSEAH
jgi:hypothetical protein